MLDGFLVLFLLYRKSMGLAAPTHAHMQDSGQIRPELFPVRYGSRVPACRKGGTSGMLRPDSAGIQLEQESCPGFWPPQKWIKNRNVPPSSNRCPFRDVFGDPPLSSSGRRRTRRTRARRRGPETRAVHFPRRGRITGTARGTGPPSRVPSVASFAATP
jgi:hypothetical protein